MEERTQNAVVKRVTIGEEVQVRNMQCRYRVLLILLSVNTPEHGRASLVGTR